MVSIRTAVKVVYVCIITWYRMSSIVLTTLLLTTCYSTNVCSDLRYRRLFFIIRIFLYSTLITWSILYICNDVHFLWEQVNNMSISLLLLHKVLHIQYYIIYLAIYTNDIIILIVCIASILCSSVLYRTHKGRTEVIFELYSFI